MFFEKQIFHNRKLAIATKHQKEKVITPLFEHHFNSKCIVPKSIDTDVLGTFSGEIERKYSPIETLRKKCQMALKESNCDLAIASEGSFGSHPVIFFSKANEELVMLYDKINNIEIIGRKLTTETNYNSKNISTISELHSFSDDVSFPSHGLIIKPSQNSNDNIVKGITSKKELQLEFEKMMSEYKSVFVETDMRALYNPTRMKIIKAATENLISNINSTCPECNAPGFIVSKTISGLPCEMCNYPTKSPLFIEYLCAHCNYTKQEKCPHKKQVESPQYCDNCNP
ncbi:MAG: hypothetical protein P1U41_09500 [Vicingaceae bacterium]|nr:hypothetical protein [Vicingaceae bacterium]